MFKGIENCVGTTVKGWGRVDVVHVDCTYLPEGSLELDIDGLWEVFVDLPEDLFGTEELELTMIVDGVRDGVNREDMDGKVLCLDKEAADELRHIVSVELWDKMLDEMDEFE